MKTTEDSTKPYASIQVIDRLMQLLEGIAQHGEPVSLKILSAQTGLHTSTAFRILASLEGHGLVERDELGRYRLGVKLLELGRQVQHGLDLPREAIPVLERLRDRLGETVNLTLRDGDEVIYAERAIASRMMRVEHVIGSRAPLHVTAVGKLFLGEEGMQACADYAERSGLPAYTQNTITDAARLKREVEVAVARGYALDDEEAEIGVGCIGAPVRDGTGRMVAALSVSAPIERRRDEWIPMVQQAAAQLSARLGFRAGAPAESPSSGIASSARPI